MSHRSIALAGAVLGAVVLPAPALAQETTVTQAAPPPAASLDDTGRLALDFRVNRFVVRNGRLAARGTAVARLSGPGSAVRTVRQRATAPVRIAQAGRRGCRLITLNLAPVHLRLLGLHVDTSTIKLRIRGIRRGAGSGVLGRLLCSLAGSRVNVRPAAARKAARALNAELPRRGLRTARATATLYPQAVTAQQRCEVLFLQLGPLELNVLGLVVELFGRTRSDPVTVTITAVRGEGILGDLFCSLASGELPTG